MASAQGERSGKVQKVAIQFIADEVVTTAEHYRDVLVFKLLGYFADPPVYAMAARDVAEMHFGKAANAPQTSNRERQVGLGCDPYIWVNDLAALHEELSAKGAVIIEGPVTRIYGSIEITVSNCNGFLIVFGD